MLKKLSKRLLKKVTGGVGMGQPPVREKLTQPTTIAAKTQPAVPAGTDQPTTLTPPSTTGGVSQKGL